MAKYSLGTATTKISPNVKKDELNLDPAKANSLKADMVKQLDAITNSLKNINNLMNQAVNKKVVRGSYATAFKGWSKKCKSQATAAARRKSTLNAKYEEDVKNFAIKVLEDRISLLEQKISKMANE